MYNGKEYSCEGIKGQVIIEVKKKESIPDERFKKYVKKCIFNINKIDMK